MINLVEYLQESVLDINMNIDLMDEKIKKQLIKEIKKFIKDNYNCKTLSINDEPNENGKFGAYCSKGNIECYNEECLTNGHFFWEYAPHDFICSCKNLDGMPKKVYASLVINDPKNGKLGSLDNIPEIVESKLKINLNYIKNLNGLSHVQCRHFEVSCNNINDLKGSPSNIKSDIYIHDCDSLESLNGLPNNIGGVLIIENCKNLKDLTGCPSRVKQVKIINCENLKSLKGFPSGTKDSYVKQCPNLVDISNASEDVYYIECPRIHEELEAKKKASEIHLNELSQKFGFKNILDVPDDHELLQQYIIVQKSYHIDRGFGGSGKTYRYSNYYMSPDLSWDKREDAAAAAARNNIKSKTNMLKSGRGTSWVVSIIKLKTALEKGEVGYNSVLQALS